MGVVRDRTESGVSANQRRTGPREEAPWLRDHRRAPRSVRTPPPYPSHTIDAANRTEVNAHENSNNNNNNNDSNNNNNNNNNRKLQHMPPGKNYSNTSEFQSPVSRNPSPSVDHRMLSELYTPYSVTKTQRINPSGSTPSPRPPSNYRMRDSKSNNPFESPDKNNATRTNPFESPSPIKRTTGNHSFESPSVSSSSNTPPQQQIINTQQSRYLSKNPTNPFDMSTSIEENSIVEDTTSHHRVRVTVHTQQNSVAVDSLEKIMDTTEETADEDESDEMAEHGGGNEMWLDEPHQQLVEQQRYSPHQRIVTSPPPYISPISHRSFVTGSDDDGTNTTATPSEKALRAAERLKKSFEHRRRERAAGIRTPVRIDEDEGQSHDGGYPYSQDEESGARILHGVAGKRRAEADARNAEALAAAAAAASGAASGAAANETEQIPPTTSQAAQNEITEVSAEIDHGEEKQHNQEIPNDADFTLHDLFDEAMGTDDLAWRNGLYLLSVQPHLGRQVEPECKMTPLHVACLGQQPPPVWITRGLLYAAPETCSQTDTGGRLPLHLLVATSADIDTIRLLVDEYPPGVAHRDDRGFTPLQLLLKRSDADGLTLEHLRLLLGQQSDGVKRQRTSRSRMLFRNGDHLKNDWVVRELESLAAERELKHESVFREYPDDVRRALTKLSQWKRRQTNKRNSNVTNVVISGRSDEENYFLQSREAEFVTPASIPTPTGQLLPLHLLVRLNIPANTAINQNMYSVKKATMVDLLRVLIAEYPRGLVEVDANGKTPVMTAMLQPNSSPSEEVVELLLGSRTSGSDGRNGMERPARIATGDTFQMPLHVAAEELLSNHSLLSTICAEYPDARTAQDIRGRTPLHLALQNYRSVPVDEATFELLFYDPVARIKDNDGKTPLDLLLENPACVIRKASQEHTSTILQEFFDASIERPRNKQEAQTFLRKFQFFPPWLRRQACAARFVQDILVEEIASPFTTFRILGSGVVLSLLLLSLRRMLHVDPDYTFLIYYLATYHLIMQMIHWGVAIYMGEFFRLCAANIWRWIDLATVILSAWCALYVSRNVADIDDGEGTILKPLGAFATMFCWLSLLGYCVEWSHGLAVFVGSSIQLLSVLVWPLCFAVMGFFAVSQVLYTLKDCSDGGICSLFEAYELLYLTALGNPVLTDDHYTGSLEIFVIILLFTIMWFWWIISVIAMIVTESNRLDRRQLSIAWYWEPKAPLTVLTAPGGKDSKIMRSPSLVDRYCDKSEMYWHIFSSALRGEKSDMHWDACCIRSNPMLFFTGLVALFLLPFWFLLGLFTFGLLWPPQIRRWIFCPRPAGSTTLRKGSRSWPYGVDEAELTKAKLSKLRSDLIDLKSIMQDQNYRIQKDLGSIKEVIFHAIMEEDSKKYN